MAEPGSRGRGRGRGRGASAQSSSTAPLPTEKQLDDVVFAIVKDRLVDLEVIVRWRLSILQLAVLRHTVVQVVRTTRVRHW